MEVDSYFALPDSGSGRPVVVLHSWWGLVEDVKRLCDRLAAEGFVALAPDLCGGAVADTVPDAQALVESLDNRAIDAAVLVAFDALMAHDATVGDTAGAIGLSMGASWALWLPSVRPQVTASVVFYGSLQGPDLERGRAAVQGHYAQDDPWEPQDELAQMRDALRAAGRVLEWHVYPGAGHWFFEPSRDAYDPEAADVAWGRTLAFLRRHVR